VDAADGETVAARATPGHLEAELMAFDNKVKGSTVVLKA
jgi:hypothetical protein